MKILHTYSMHRSLLLHLYQLAACRKCKSSLLCLEFADKMLIFAVLKRWLLQQRETEDRFVFIIFAV